ncbi:MAG: DUF2179 domain-containing protein [Desulfomonilaceae bacterium]
MELPISAMRLPLATLYCVVTRLEIGKVKTMVRAIDRSAFVVYHPLADVEGGVVKKAGLH